ncbi:GAF domain-containing protein [Herpetosiphon llansteffanensis]|uniref:GAF domain-containing protein n=1 Tax=Herpetosiphon llansteffanensis TaxID=2094568 RepID=UPI0013E06C6E|nr:GAF domain-containing protein [Herpetosiphon llansteffanensis]
MQPQEQAFEDSPARLMIEWLPRLATATTINGLHTTLSAALKQFRHNQHYHLVWLDLAETQPEIPLDLMLSSSQQEQLEQGIILTITTADKLRWTMLPLLHITLRGWLALPEAQPSDQQLLPLAFQAAASMCTITNNQQLVAELRELTQFNLISQRLNSSLELGPLIEAVNRGIQQMFGPQNLFVTLYDTDSQLFQVAAHFYADGHSTTPNSQWTVAHGLTGVIIRRNEPIITDRYLETCAHYHVTPLFIDDDTPPLFWAGVPLRFGERVLGTLVIYTREPEVRYNADTLRKLEMLAHRAADNFEQARLYERTTRQARQLELLNELGRTITSTLDFEAVPSLIMGRVQELLNVEEGSLLLLDEATNELVFRYSLSPVGQQLLGNRIPSNVGIAGLVLRTGESLIANRAGDHPAFYTGIDMLVGHETRDLLCVPLLGAGGVKGVIEILNHRSGLPFTAADRALLEAVADQAVIAIENANLYTQTDQALTRRISELDQRNKQFQEIVQIGNALKAASNLGAVLPDLAEAVQSATGFNQVTISLVQTTPGHKAIIKRVASAGIDSQIFAAQASITIEPARVEALLKPQYRRGESTYYIDHRRNGDARLWPDPQNGIEVPELRTGMWHPNDSLFAVLRSTSGDLLGLLTVYAPKNGLQPTTDQIQMLEIFATQLAVALENNRLYDRQRQTVEGLTALSALGMAINSTFSDAQAIWQFTVGGMVDWTGALGAGVLLSDPNDPTTLQPIVGLGVEHTPDEAIIQFAHKVLERDKPLLLGNSAQLPSVLRELGGQALVMLPLLATHKTLGVIYLWYPETLPNREAQDLLSLFVGQAAVAVETRRLAEEVSNGRDRLASILASTEEGIILLNSELRVVEVNAAAQTMIGSSEVAELLGEPVDLLLTHWCAQWNKSEEAWSELTLAIYKVSRGRLVEGRGQLELGGLRSQWLEWTTLPVQSAANQSPHPIIIVLRDITTEIEAENLRHDLTYMMIHDLRGPLSSVMTSLDMLAKKMVGDLSEGQDKIVKIALRSSARLLDMVNLLMDISKLEAGQMPITPITVAVDDVIRSVMQNYEPLLNERKVHVALNIAENTPKASVDVQTLERVVQNLLDNAIKFSPASSTITIDVHKAQAGQLPNDHPNGQWILLGVRDAGPGIPAQYRERVFEKFAQVKQTGIKGTGLGLTYCRLAIETHGGRIWVANDDGPGALFLLTIPIA